MSQKQRGFIPNKVFIGCPWNIRGKYDRAIDYFRTRFPLNFVLVGKEDGQDADELLTIIKDHIESSSRAIFDATGGNANVSLEYGFAEAWGVERSIYICNHGRTSTKASAIISDLAGKKRNHYKQEKQLKNLLSEMARDHSYTKRFETALGPSRSRRVTGSRKRSKALALKIIHALEREDAIRREEVIQKVLVDKVMYKRLDVEKMLQTLNSKGLIQVTPGRTSYVRIA